MPDTANGSATSSGKITYGSLFSGVGGFDLGCDAAGWDCRWQVEWDEKCRQVLAHHWPTVNRYEDVRDVAGMGLLQHDGDGANSAPASDEHRSSDGLGVPVLGGDDAAGSVDIPLAGRSADGPDSEGTVSDADAQQGPRSVLEPVDVITFGFPCQDLSVAGKRAGLDGARSGLFFEAVRIIREMREATNGLYPRVAVAENVVGLLNADQGSAMERCLEALAEVGAVALEWRVLDAQFFGVPQRRRRVFLVAVFDSGAAGRGQVFPEPESVRGNPATGDETGQAVAGTLGGGSGSRGWAADTERMTFVPGRTNALTARGNPGNARDAETQGFIFPDGQPEVSATVTAKWAKGTGGYAGVNETENLVTTSTVSASAVAMNQRDEVRLSEVHPALVQPGGRPGNGTPTIIQTFVKAGRARSKDDAETWKADGPAPTLNVFDNGGDTRATILAIPADGLPDTTGTLTTAFGAKNYGNIQEVLSGSIIPTEQPVTGTPDSGIVGALTTRMMAYGSPEVDANHYLPTQEVPELPNTTGTVMASWSHGPGNAQVEEGLVQPVLAPTLTASNNPSRSPQSAEVTQQVAAVNAAGLGVRRLTPRECERLMGWGDDHTRYAADGKEIADSHRYRMCGNGVAAPVAKYIATCVARILS